MKTGNRDPLLLLSHLWRMETSSTADKPPSSSGLCHTVLQLLVSEAECCVNVRFGNMSFLCFQLSFSILHNSLVFLTTLPFQSHGEEAHWATAGSEHNTRVDVVDHSDSIIWKHILLLGTWVDFGQSTLPKSVWQVGVLYQVSIMSHCARSSWANNW